MIDWATHCLHAIAATLMDGGSAATDTSEVQKWPSGFGYMVAAYAAVWLILMGYFWLLSRRARRLADRAETLLEK